jgi:hypothetical protein
MPTRPTASADGRGHEPANRSPLPPCARIYRTGRTILNTHLLAASL